jgi:hypothetical protein
MVVEVVELVMVEVLKQDITEDQVVVEVVVLMVEHY